jgi:hypothetical protein
MKMPVRHHVAAEDRTGHDSGRDQRCGTDDARFAVTRRKQRGARVGRPMSPTTVGSAAIQSSIAPREATLFTADATPACSPGTEDSATDINGGVCRVLADPCAVGVAGCRTDPEAGGADGREAGVGEGDG